MSAEQLGKTGIPSAAQSESRKWVRDVGETITQEWRGEKAATLAKYNALKADIGLAQVSYSNAEGRSRVVAEFARNDDDVTIVEELLGIDLVRNIYAAETFRTLTDDQLSAVMLATESRAKDAEINGYSSWSAKQKELRYQMMHGQESYYETAFLLRIRKQGVRSSKLRGAFAGINTVVDLPALSAGMREIVGTLPDGEWLYKPPQVGYIQRGIWNVSTEYHWAKKWSVVYGGTLKGFMT
jgi:hypothetical protein